MAGLADVRQPISTACGPSFRLRPTAADAIDTGARITLVFGPGPSRAAVVAVCGLLALAGLAMVAVGLENRFPVDGVELFLRRSFYEQCRSGGDMLSVQVCEANHRRVVFAILGVVGLVVAGVGSMLAVMSWRRARRRT